MTEQLQRAFDRVAALSPSDQDQFAAWMLAELESEERWQKLFAESQDALANLAAEARAEHEAGLTEALDPDAL